LGEAVRPLASRCAAAGKTRKALGADEEPLAHCLRRNDPYCPENAQQVCVQVKSRTHVLIKSTRGFRDHVYHETKLCQKPVKGGIE
jgi:hypothetical protein